MRDAATNRRHQLGRIPPALRPCRAMNGGVMRCLVWARGACPYRSRYGCSDADRIDGILSGQCVIELQHREEIGAPMRRLLADHLEGEERNSALKGLELFIDALVYRDRAAAYAGVVMDRELDWMGSAEYWMTVTCYREAGSQRLWRRYVELRPMIERAMREKEESDWRTKIAAMSAITDDPVACSP